MYTTSNTLLLTFDSCRYTSKSCNSLTPIYKEETYGQFGFGPNDNDEEYDEDEDDDRKDKDEEDYEFESPKQSSRNGAFRIELDFEGYRKNGEYQSGY